MRKSLLKSVVAVAVVGATMAITSVAAMAADPVNAFVTGEKDSTLSAVTEYSEDTDVISVKSVDGQVYTIKASDTNYHVSDAQTVNRALRTNVKTKDGSVTQGLQLAYTKEDGTSASNFRPGFDITPKVDGTITIYTYYQSDSSGKNVALVTVSGDTRTAVKSADADRKQIVSYSYDVTANTKYQLGGCGSNHDFVGVVFVPSDAAPTLEDGIANGVTDQQVAVVKSGDKFYAVALISAAQAEAINSFTVNGSAYSEVFTSVQLGSTEYTAANLGGANSTDLVYGFEVTVTGAPESLAAIQGQISFSE